MPAVRLDIVDIELFGHLGCECREIHPRQLGVTIAVGGALDVGTKRIRGNRDAVTWRSREGNVGLRCDCGPYLVRTTGDEATGSRHGQHFEKNAPRLHGEDYSLSFLPRRYRVAGSLPLMRFCRISAKLSLGNQ